MAAVSPKAKANQKEAQKKYAKTKRGRERGRAALLKYRYGLTPDVYEELFQKQNGFCAICRVAPIKHIDHDHETDKFRGLLCHCCNVGLGHFRDNTELLQNAIDYLEESRNA